MLIRMFVDSIILGVLLLAGLGLCTAEEDGYDYSRPSLGFSDGINSVGSQSIYTKPTVYVVASSTPKPAVVYNVKPQASINQANGQYQQYKAPIVTKPQTLFGGSSSFGQSSATFSRPASSIPQYGQYQNTQKYESAKPQAYFGANQGFGQFSSGSGQYVSGQYKAPIISVTSKPQTNKGAYQGFSQSGLYKAPLLSMTQKPQAYFGASQGYGQISSGSGQYVSGQYKAPVISVTSKPQTNLGTYQGFGQSSSGTSFGQFASGQYKAPVTSKPQGFDNKFFFSGSSSKPSSGSNGKQKPQVTVLNVSNAKPIKPVQAQVVQAKPVQAQVVQAQVVQAKPVQAQVVQAQVVQAQVVQAKPVQAQFVQAQVVQAKPVQAQFISAKPQFGFSSFQGFGHKINQQPSQTGQYQSVQYQKPSTGYSQTTFSQYKQPIVTPKPLTTFGSFQGSSVSKPLTAFGNTGPSYLPPSKPQSTIEIQPTSTPAISQYNFQGASSTVAPAVLEPVTISTTPKPVVITVKPQTSFNQFQGSFVKPTFNAQSSFSGFQGFGQSSPKPFVQYQKPLVSNPIKSQSTFGSFQGFGQSYYQKPAISQTYYKPSTTIKPQLSYLPPKVQEKPISVSQEVSDNYSSTPSALEPVVVTPKPVSSEQSVYQKPASNNFEQQSSTIRYTSTPSTTAKPLIVTAKPQTAFSGYGQSVYQKPAVSSFSAFGQQSYKPQTAFSGYGQSVYQKPAISTFNTFGQQSASSYTITPTTVKPLIITSKPQTTFSGYEQSVYQKPAVSSFSTFGQQPFKPIAKPQTTFSGYGQSVYQKPAINTFNSFGQQSGSRFTSTPTTAKPLYVSPKPQSAFSGYGQSVYQKPAINAFNSFGQQSFKPQTTFSGYGQSVYQKPAINAFNSFGQQSGSRYTNTPTTAKPLIVSAKPQTAFSGYGQSVYQKPAVSSFSAFGQQSYKPQTAFSGYGQSVYQKPAISTFNTFGQQSASRFTSTPTTVKPFTVTAVPQTTFEQRTYQKPLIVSTTPSPQVSFVSTTLAPKPTLAPESLAYLPPQGVNAPLTAESASGAVSESFFEFPSATANQVVDVAHEQKVGGFVADQKSELPSTITNQVSNVNAQEQQVEEIDLRFNELTATNKGQEQEKGFYKDYVPSQRRRRDTYSNGGYEADFTTQTYLSYQGNPITTQQFGGVQPNSYQGIPYQQIAQAQSSVGINGDGDGTALCQESFQPDEQAATSNGTPNQDPYNYEEQFGYISSVEDQQQQIPQNYETAASYTDAVNTQAASDSPVQDPQPLNKEEQQIRQVEEKPDNNFQNLQPGSYIGPHVNKNSDHEYNVFDYDQYSKDPEDADV